MQKNGVKSSSVAGVLGVFLGALGGHDWYLGNTKRAITHVTLTVGGLILLVIGVILTNMTKDVPVFNMLFVCFIIAAYIVLVGNGVWGFIEGVIILAQGDAGLKAKGYQVAAEGTQADVVAGVKNFFSPKEAGREEAKDKEALAGGAAANAGANTATAGTTGANTVNPVSTSGVVPSTTTVPGTTINVSTTAGVVAAPTVSNPAVQAGADVKNPSASTVAAVGGGTGNTNVTTKPVGNSASTVPVGAGVAASTGDATTTVTQAGAATVNTTAANGTAVNSGAAKPAMQDSETVAVPEAGKDTSEVKTENRVNDVPQPTISTPGVDPATVAAPVMPETPKAEEKTAAEVVTMPESGGVGAGSATVASASTTVTSDGEQG